EPDRVDRRRRAGSFVRGAVAPPNAGGRDHDHRDVGARARGERGDVLAARSDLPAAAERRRATERGTPRVDSAAVHERDTILVGLRLPNVRNDRPGGRRARNDDDLSSAGAASARTWRERATRRRVERGGELLPAARRQTRAWPILRRG